MPTKSRTEIVPDGLLRKGSTESLAFFSNKLLLLSKRTLIWSTHCNGLIAVTPATKVKPLRFSIADDFRRNTIRSKSVLVDFQPVSKLCRPIV